MKRMRMTLGVVALLSAGAPVDAAQPGTAPATSPPHNLRVDVVGRTGTEEPVVAPLLIGHPGMFLPPGMLNEGLAFATPVDGRPVKGKPFSAMAITESIQVLQDGNRIIQTMKTRQYRDAEGRTRQENLATEGADEGQVITVRISDPVAGNNWILVPGEQVALRLPRLELNSGDATAPLDVFTAAVPAPGLAATNSMGTVFLASPAEVTSPGNAVTEDLGKRVLEGIDTRGRRDIQTTPAGTIGNELPIVRVTETWRADAIESVVLMTITDPLQGNVSYALTDLELGDSPRTLFEVPADFRIVDEPLVPPELRIPAQAPATAPQP